MITCETMAIDKVESRPLTSTFSEYKHRNPFMKMKVSKKTTIRYVWAPQFPLTLINHLLQSHSENGHFLTIDPLEPNSRKFNSQLQAMTIETKVRLSVRSRGCRRSCSIKHQIIVQDGVSYLELMGPTVRAKYRLSLPVLTRMNLNNGAS